MTIEDLAIEYEHETDKNAVDIFTNTWAEDFVFWLANEVLKGRNKDEA